MLALALTLSLAASPNPRVTYELKCLYCHSEEVAERVRLGEAGWLKLIEKMRRKAPMLITRRDVTVVARFMTREKGLVPPTSKTPVAVKPPTFEPPLLPAPEPPTEPLKVPPPEVAAAPEPDAEAEQLLEQQGFALMQHRCSKCHTLSRVYTKLDGLERTLSVIERMELKTGSGITEKDAELLERYVRGQFAD